jgi:hypothetical protein
MLETYFSAAKMLEHLRSRPSGPYLDGFAEVLERQGYGPETAVRYLRAAAHIGHTTPFSHAVPVAPRPADADPEQHGGGQPPLCPCCGGRMTIIEIIECSRSSSH